MAAPHEASRDAFHPITAHTDLFGEEDEEDDEEDEEDDDDADVVVVVVVIVVVVVAGMDGWSGAVSSSRPME